MIVEPPDTTARGPDIVAQGARQRAQIDAVVVVEATVFDREKRLQDLRVEIGERCPPAAASLVGARGPQRQAVAVEQHEPGDGPGRRHGVRQWEAIHAAGTAIAPSARAAASHRRVATGASLQPRLRQPVGGGGRRDPLGSGARQYVTHRL